MDRKENPRLRNMDGPSWTARYTRRSRNKGTSNSSPILRTNYTPSRRFAKQTITACWKCSASRILLFNSSQQSFPFDIVLYSKLIPSRIIFAFLQIEFVLWVTRKHFQHHYVLRSRKIFLQEFQFCQISRKKYFGWSLVDIINHSVATTDCRNYCIRTCM